MLQYLAENDNNFPDPQSADQSLGGLLCCGSNLNSETLVKAYKLGIFPWSSDPKNLLWWSPDPRLILTSNSIHNQPQHETMDYK